MDNTNVKKKKKKGEGAKRWWPGWLHMPFFVIIGFLIVMIFFGDNSYLKIVGYNEHIDALNAEIKANRDSAAYYIQQSHMLETDPETLEKIAREHYGMKRDKEDVYVTDIP